KLHVVLVVPVGLVDVGLLPRLPVQQEPFGQRRPLVGPLDLVPDQQHPARETLLAERLRRLGACQARSGDDERLLGHGDLLQLTCSHPYSAAWGATRVTARWLKAQHGHRSAGKEASGRPNRARTVRSGPPACGGGPWRTGPSARRSGR